MLTEGVGSGGCEDGGGDAANPLVLIAPAMAIGSWYYTPLIEEFERRHWQARALGRRGFEKDQPRASRRADWSYADEIHDIAAAVSAARTDNPARPVLILGHSLGGQLAVGHQLSQPPADAVVTVGAAIPHYRHFPAGGLAIATMAAVIVPLATAVMGYLPKPFFGGPGARTLMREWAHMVLTGATPFPAPGLIAAPALIVSLAGDRMSPAAAVDELATRLFDPRGVTRWLYADDDVRPGASNDHITWVRAPHRVVDEVVHWWNTAPRNASAVGLAHSAGSQPNKED